MSNDFQQTVDLKKKTAGQARPESAQEKRPVKKKLKARLGPAYGESKQAAEIDRVYGADEENNIVRRDMRRIHRPVVKQVNEPVFKWVVAVLAVVLTIAVIYALFTRGNDDNPETADLGQTPGWYAVKLVNEETYYGKIKDIAANPIVIESVYYDYDQLNPGEGEKSESGNLRLVKRGKETHGPSGTMYIYQDQVQIIDVLREDSKVLKAILDYER